MGEERRAASYYLHEYEGGPKGTGVGKRLDRAATRQIKPLTTQNVTRRAAHTRQQSVPTLSKDNCERMMFVCAAQSRGQGVSFAGLQIQPEAAVLSYCLASSTLPIE